MDLGLRVQRFSFKGLRSLVCRFCSELSGFTCLCSGLGLLFFLRSEHVGDCCKSSFDYYGRMSATLNPRP